MPASARRLSSPPRSRALRVGRDLWTAGRTWPSWATPTKGVRVMRRFTNVIGFDDAPFVHDHRGDVRLVGVICARTRVDGVLSGKVRRDGVNATTGRVSVTRAAGKSSARS